MRVSVLGGDSHGGAVLGEEVVESCRRLRFVVRGEDTAQFVPEVVDSCQVASSWRLGDISPHSLVVVEEGFERGKIADGIVSADGPLVGVDQVHGQSDWLTVVMCKIHLTRYLSSCTVTSVRPDTTYVNEETAMDINPHIAADMHQYRTEEIHRAAEPARLTSSLPRKTRSYQLGRYRFTLTKDATPQVPSPA